MSRCYPAEPEFPDERRAERAVWEALRHQLPADAALFHPVPLLEGDREHELDLLVAWPGVGLGVLEGKGGHVTRDEQGWHQESAGQRRRSGTRRCRPRTAGTSSSATCSRPPARRTAPGPPTSSLCPSPPCPRGGRRRT